MASNTTTGWKHDRNSAITVTLRGRSRGISSSSPVNFRQSFMKSEQLSARKLAAGLWQLRFLELSGVHSFSFTSSKAKPFQGAIFETSVPCMKSSKEEATKWNQVLVNEASNNFKKVHSRKLPEDRKSAGQNDSVIVTVLLEELLQAQRSINKLKATQKSSEKKVKLILHALEEEKALWKSREHHKIEAMLGDLKDKLSRERRSRERMEVLNSKLVHELKVANESAKQFMTKYEKEKKERELIEEVCDELAMQMGEEKDKAEVLMSDSVKICKELEQEREMMQMIEHWREERVQMKLEDAKHLLEDKYNEMVNLIASLQMFLRSKGAEVDTTEIEDTQLIKQAVASVNIQKIVELSYDFSNSDDVFPIYCEENGKDIEIVDEEGVNKNSVLHLDQSSPSSENYKQQRSKHKSFVEDGRFKHCELLGQGNSRDYNNMKNPHITRGTKGCIEWPHGNSKNNSNKVTLIPLDERVKSQKSQLQHILKPKAY